MTVLRFGPATQADALVLLLHGVGASAEAMRPLASLLSARLPNAAVLAPDGTAPFDMGPGGRQWFSVRGVSEDNRKARVEAALPAIETLLDEACALVGVPRERAVVAGFSQGAILALHLAAAAKQPPAAIVALAGRLSAGPLLTHPGPRPSVFMSHGAQDRVIALSDAQHAADALRAIGAEVQFEQIPDHGHSIDPRQVESVARYVAARLPSGRMDLAQAAKPHRRES
ncbi:alpha/beta hydrolase [Caulobacter endophyticus]|uniref:Hydrolase n=1 Tax=Caulobacter endophyticus TaxID=2172652 RepID=A0A2T9JF53_9CAUL|nr:alpha/beta fold hydrolase [Caulobacter endophyticus]PVM82296.1 hydrolase [Caulobacter endophyticus]